MHPHLVILAGGVSSRMKEHADPADGSEAALFREAGQKPKSMIGIGEEGRPFMDYLLYNAREAGYRDVVIVTGENDDAVRARYGRKEKGNSFHGLAISYAVQRIPTGRHKPLGTADALLCALHSRPDWRGTQFTVCNSDNLYSQEVFRRLLSVTQASALIDYDRDALAFDEERIGQFAILVKDAEGYLVRIIEKPSPREIGQARDASGRIGVSMNIFRLSYDLILQPLADVPLNAERQEKELPGAIALMIARHPRSMVTIPTAEYVLDLTGKRDLTGVQKQLRAMYRNISLWPVSRDS